LCENMECKNMCLIIIKHLTDQDARFGPLELSKGHQACQMTASINPSFILPKTR
jgi:hypothetical protein